jgi:hypothetical protein
MPNSALISSTAVAYFYPEPDNEESVTIESVSWCKFTVKADQKNKVKKMD